MLGPGVVERYRPIFDADDQPLGQGSHAARQASSTSYVWRRLVTKNFQPETSATELYL